MYTAITARFTELDVDDPDLELRGDAYEHAYLAAYAHPKVGGVHLWGWAKEAISAGQDARSNTQLVASLTVRQHILIHSSV
eukprot:7489-Heterococcus_DN1.PRE.2